MTEQPQQSTQQYLPPPEFVIDTLRQQLVNAQDRVNMLEIQNGFLNTVIEGLSHELQHATGVEHGEHSETPEAPEELPVEEPV